MTPEERKELREHVLGSVVRFHPLDQARRGTDGAGLDETALGLAQLPAATGWTGIEVATELGGSGEDFTAVVVVAQAMANAMGPFGFAGLAGMVLPALTSEPSRFDALIRDCVDGQSSFGVLMPDGALGSVDARRDASGYVVDGCWTHVSCDSTNSHLLLVVEDDVHCFVAVIDAGSDGVSSSPLPGYDLTRRFVRVELRDVVVAEADVVAAGNRARGLVEVLRDRYSVLLAADSLGVAERAMDLALEYAKLRRQFDRPIGSFQVIKHRFSDMYAQVECSRALVEAAAHAVATRAPDRSPLAAMAKAHACDMAAEVAAQVINVHGGIGYTWEADPHMFLKRAKLNQALGGTTREHAESVGKWLVEDSTGREEPS